MVPLSQVVDQFLTDAGAVLNGGKLHFHQAGTTTDQDIYTTPAGTVVQANPVVLDSAGRPSSEPHLHPGKSYRLTVDDSADSEVSDFDDIHVSPDLGFATDTGSADSVAVAPSNAVVDLVDGLRVTFQAAADNTGATTLALSGLTAKDLVARNGNALRAGEIRSGGVYTAVYDAGNDDFYLVQASGDLQASTTWNPGSIANGAGESKEVTVTGAEMGDFAIASFSLDIEDLDIVAAVTAANTVKARLINSTGGAVDLGSGTLRVRVLKK